MYGTLAKIRLKPGAEEDFHALRHSYESNDVPGFHGTFVLRTDGDPDTCYMLVMFDDRASYWDNAESPEQHERYLQMRDLLEVDPEWYDGEVLGPAT